jgi:O-antigen/teichoic acid export membrane protein
LSRIVRNTTAVTAAFAANTTLSFLQVKLLTRWLPQAELGEYFATVALGALISVLAQIGLPMVVLRFTAKYDALDDAGRIRRLVRFAWLLVLGLSVVLLLAERRLLPLLLPRIYDAPPAIASVMLATGVFIATALRQVTYACFDGMRRMSYPALFENLNVGLITLAIVLLRHELSLVRLLEISLVSGVVFCIVSAAVLLRLLARQTRAMAASEVPGAASPSPVSPSPPRPALLPDIAPFWSGAALNGLVGICMGYADKALISLFVPFELVSIFYVAERLTFLMKRLLALPLQVASPEITRRWELGRRDALRTDLGFMLKVQLATAMLVAIMTYLVAESAVLLVSAPAYLPAADLLRVLAVSVVLMGLYAPITTFMRAIERIHLALASDILWISVYLTAGALLVPRLDLRGIVLAQVTASTLTAVFNLVVGQRVGRIRWDLGGVARVAVLGLAMAAGGGLLVRDLAPLAWPLAIGAGAGAVLLYHVLLVASGALSIGDRRRFRSLAGTSRFAGALDATLFWPLRLWRGREDGAGDDDDDAGAPA